MRGCVVYLHIHETTHASTEYIHSRHMTRLIVAACPRALSIINVFVQIDWLLVEG